MTFQKVVKIARAPACFSNHYDVGPSSMPTRCAVMFLVKRMFVCKIAMRYRHCREDFAFLRRRQIRLSGAGLQSSQRSMPVGYNRSGANFKARLKRRRLQEKRLAAKSTGAKSAKPAK